MSSEEREQSETNESAIGKGKPRILVADDSKVVRISAEKILGDEFDTVLAVNGEDAWEVISQDNSIQAVFTDLGMPYLDGYGLLERIRKSEDEEISGIPVIVVTGNEDDNAREEALEHGATDFIAKPFNRIDLLARARTHANYRSKTRELTKQNKELEEYTTVDRVTRLGNKHYFFDKLEQDWSFCKRHQQDLTVLRIDIDNIKQVIKSVGKEELIPLLRQLGSIFRACIRREDSAARIEAIQFALLLPTCNNEAARVIARRIQSTVREAMKRRKDNVLDLTLSIGMVTPTETPDIGTAEIMRRAEQVLTTAAAKGGGKIESYEKGKSVPAPSPKPDVLGLEEALIMISKGEGKEVEPHVGELLKKIAPLLRLAGKGRLKKLFAALGMKTE